MKSSVRPTSVPANPNDPPIRMKDGIPISFTLYTNNNPLQVALANAVARNGRTSA